MRLNNKTISSFTIALTLLSSAGCASLQKQIAEQRVNQQLARAPPGTMVKQRSGNYDLWDGKLWRGYHRDGTPDGSITSIKRHGIIRRNILYERAEIFYYP